ncbi:MAG: hypothetical protein JSW09_07610 [Pseudomonadota bacterium]|nr:MAG: hypothetical protein JSW09_07610 [Pseudomonadota bacterium]
MRARFWLSVAAVLVAGGGLAAADSVIRKWKPVTADELHDPQNPAVPRLQNPAEALSVLPPANAGNQVDWVKALRDGKIQPRTHIDSNTPLRILDSEVIMTRTGDMPYVRFPHRAHTEWLDCSNCHDALFASKIGATPITMLAILQGEYCGRCHGAVSFPLTECARCHNTPKAAAGAVPRRAP